jgi:beta-hydroxylase
LVDAGRSGWRFDTFDRYFLGNGVTVWLLSPLNLLLDLLSLPHRNKGVYALDDLPEGHRREIQRIVDLARERRVVEQLEPKLRDDPRSMLFFKWHGANRLASVDVPEFHERYEHVRTIGVSVLDRHASTSEHFGPLRMTLRVLYNLTPVSSGDVYIRVGGRRHEWRHDPLFIFDDTLSHQSVNGSDARRYCLFLDVMRPAPWPGLLRAVVAPLQAVVGRINAAFYRRWTFVE